MRDVWHSFVCMQCCVPLHAGTGCFHVINLSEVLHSSAGNCGASVLEAPSRLLIWVHHAVVMFFRGSRLLQSPLHAS